MLPKSFRSFADFEREILRPNARMGMTLEEMIEDSAFDVEAELDFSSDDDDDDDE